jgi:hypothetical protein
MVSPEQVEIESNVDDAYHAQEVGKAKLAIGIREFLSKNFNSDIEAWARHALASNGFGNYLR